VVAFSATLLLTTYAVARGKKLFKSDSLGWLGMWS
jgi:hypothetical protein